MKNFDCSVCSETFQSQRGLSLHTSAKHSVNTLQCCHCLKTMSSSRSLKKHLETCKAYEAKQNNEVSLINKDAMINDLKQKLNELTLSFNKCQIELESLRQQNEQLLEKAKIEQKLQETNEKLIQELKENQTKYQVNNTFTNSGTQQINYTHKKTDIHQIMSNLNPITCESIQQAFINVTKIAHEQQKILNPQEFNSLFFEQSFKNSIYCSDLNRGTANWIEGDNGYVRHVKDVQSKKLTQKVHSSLQSLNSNPEIQEQIIQPYKDLSRKIRDEAFEDDTKTADEKSKLMSNSSQYLLLSNGNNEAITDLTMYLTKQSTDVQAAKVDVDKHLLSMNGFFRKLLFSSDFDDDKYTEDNEEDEDFNEAESKLKKLQNLLKMSSFEFTKWFIKRLQLIGCHVQNESVPKEDQAQPNKYYFVFQNDLEEIQKMKLEVLGTLFIKYMLSALLHLDHIKSIYMGSIAHFTDSPYIQTMIHHGDKLIAECVHK